MSERETYYFKRLDNGEIVTLQLTFEERQERVDVLRRIVLDDGTEAVLDFGQQDVNRQERIRRRAWANPIASDALAVHPSQVAEFREAARIDGVPTEFRPTGEPVFTSARHQANYAATRGYVNRDGIFSGKRFYDRT